MLKCLRIKLKVMLRICLFFQNIKTWILSKLLNAALVLSIVYLTKNKKSRNTLSNVLNNAIELLKKNSLNAIKKQFLFFIYFLLSPSSLNPY